MKTCPCGSAEAYATCCERFHRGAEPETPERLMRARYAAFVKQESEFLFRTLHSQHDDKAAGEAGLRRGLKAQKGRVVYQGLEILETVDADESGAAEVLFHVSVSSRGKDQSFEERSIFVRDDPSDGEKKGAGKRPWRYLTGTLTPSKKRP